MQNEPQIKSSASVLVTVTAGDYTPLPAKSLTHRGVELTRSTCIRAMHSGLIESRLLRQPGSKKGRRYLLTASIDSYLERCMVDVPPVRQIESAVK